MSEKLLDIDGLCVAFRGQHGAIEVLSHAGFAVEPGEVVGVVGESGSGKSVMARHHAFAGLSRRDHGGSYPLRGT
jgi:peptide/nickel transport system ATP-binding protein